MASKMATHVASNTFVSGGDVPRVAAALNEYGKFQFEEIRLKWFVFSVGMYCLKKGFIIAKPDTFAVQSIKTPFHFDDWYNRIHLAPTEIDFKTVAASQRRQVYVWNAFVDRSAELDFIEIDQPKGLEVTGPQVPRTMTTLSELQFEVIVTTSGSPSINANIQFGFTNVESPAPIRILGTRAIKFDIVPEIPVTEKWEWLTDVIQAVDSTEQRISMRGEFPRIEQSVKMIFDKVEDIRKFYSDVAIAAGRLWIPMYQHSARITKNSLIGATRVYFDVNRIDIRAKEYVLFKIKDVTVLAEVSKMETDGATLTSPLLVQLDEGSLIVQGAPAIIDNSRIKRVSVDTVAEVSLNAKMQMDRSSLPRPGHAATLVKFNGLPVLEKRPLADSTVDDAFETGQELFDNQTGVQEVATRWDYARVSGERDFKIDRILKPEQMDFWKLFLSHCKGSARKFYMPTFRTDLALKVQINEGANAFTAVGSEYAEKLYTLPTHRTIEFETDGGIHRANITSASPGNNESFIGFEPPLPSGRAFANIKRIGFLIETRLANDTISFKHYGLESILSISIISAEKA